MHVLAVTLTTYYTIKADANHYVYAGRSALKTWKHIDWEHTWDENVLNCCIHVGCVMCDNNTIKDALIPIKDLEDLETIQEPFL